MLFAVSAYETELRL